MAADGAGVGGRSPEFMFTAACTPLILASGIAGCNESLQPDSGLPGINGVRMALLE
jgi:hypothetical protein